MRSEVRFFLAPRAISPSSVGCPRAREPRCCAAPLAGNRRGAASGRRVARALRTRPSLRVAIVGTGAVAARAARQLASTDSVEKVVVHGTDPERVERIVASLGRTHAEPGQADVLAGQRPDAVILAGSGSGVTVARAAVAAGVPVVSVHDSVAEVRSLLAIDAEARDGGVPVVVGAGFAPGLSCLLAAHAASAFDVVDEVHVARVGTAGPACARQHHNALSGSSIDWRGGGGGARRGGARRGGRWVPPPARAGGRRPGGVAPAGGSAVPPPRSARGPPPAPPPPPRSSPALLSLR